jgi:hypothetical protein
MEVALAGADDLAQVHGGRERPVALDDANDRLELPARLGRFNEDTYGLALLRPRDDARRVEDNEQRAHGCRVLKRRHAVTSKEVERTLDGNRAPTMQALDECLRYRLAGERCAMRVPGRLVVADDEDALVEGDRLLAEFSLLAQTEQIQETELSGARAFEDGGANGLSDFVAARFQESLVEAPT